MTTPMIFENDLSIDKHSPKEDALFTAYMDMQKEFDQEDFALPLEDDIIELLDDNLF